MQMQYICNASALLKVCNCINKGMQLHCTWIAFASAKQHRNNEESNNAGTANHTKAFL